MCVSGRYEELGRVWLEKLGTLNSGEKTIAVVRDRWWPQTAKEKGDKTGNICFM